VKGAAGERTIPERLIRVVGERLSEGKQVRRTLPVWGRLAIDRPLPFLCVYRRPRRTSDTATFRLVTSEASYLTCLAERRQQAGVSRLAGVVAETMAERFGSFLVVELWAGKPVPVENGVSVAPLRPGFRLFAPKDNDHAALTDSFEEMLRRIRLGGRRATVETIESARRWPRALAPIIPREEADRIGCLFYGLEISPIYIDPVSGQVYPGVLRNVRRRLTVALRRVFFDFARTSTKADPAHYHTLGRRAVVQAVWKVDEMLATTSETYEFLLQLTPVNGEQAWRRFERSRFEREPAFHYRPLPVEPIVLKRRLYRAPVERIEDPSLGLVFRQKLDEIDRQITMLQDRNTDRFLHESIQLYGGVEEALHRAALDLLERIPPRSRERKSAGVVDAEAFAIRAREEIEFLRSQRSDVNARVEIRPDVTGLLVSRGNLLVSAYSRIPVSRVEALVQHEIGTHVLTYHNGRAQKLRLLYTGLAGYDSLQEGLAVLSEYLVGGLSRPRLRLLAGRVVAARCLLDGATFVDTFRELRKKHGFSGRVAYTVSLRTYRSGGLTKDAVYLRGLQQILEYIADGGSVEPLFTGKMASQHIPIIRELRWRGVLVPPPLAPRYMNQPDPLLRLERLRRGASVADLLEGDSR
jgi:uncharacterized protein (TIGR02421 family)